VNKRNKKVFLIYPPTGLYDRSDRCQSYYESETGELISPPMDLLYMAATLEKEGYSCFVRDYPVEKKGWEETIEDLERERPSVLIISTTASTIKEDLKACDIMKRIDKGSLTIGKGGYGLDTNEAILKLNDNLDVFINSEPEFAVRDLARKAFSFDAVNGITYRINGEIYSNQKRQLNEDLDTLPLPARHLLNNGLYRMPDTGKKFTTIITGRGCPFRCIYCLAGRVGGKTLRLRSPVNIVTEMEECIKTFGIKIFWIRADTFTFDKKWVLEICRIIIDRGIPLKWMTNSRVDKVDDEMLGWMKRAGCMAIAFGVESGNQELLNKMKKGITLDVTRSAVQLCRRHGIKTYLNFVIGLPWESEDTFEDTMQFAKSLKADMYNFSISYPFPGTELYDYVKEHGLLKSDEDLVKAHGFFEPVADTFFMKKENLAKLKSVAFKRVMLEPGFIIRTIVGARSPRILWAYAKEAVRLFKVIHKGANTHGG